MNTDVEQLLQESMERLAAVSAAPAGLVGRARRRLRRRRLAMISAAAGTAAAVTAVAVVTAAGAGRPASTVSSALTAAYVISRVENALAGENFVIQARASGIMSGSVHGHRYRYSGGANDSWTYGIRNRMEEFTGRDCGHVDSNGWCTHRGGSVRYLADGTALIRGKLVSAYITYYDHRYVVRQEHGTGVSPVAWDRAGPGSAVAVADDYGLVWRRSTWRPVRQWHGTTPGGAARVREVHLLGRAPCWAAAGSPGAARVCPQGRAERALVVPGGSGAGCAARPGRWPGPAAHL